MKPTESSHKNITWAHFKEYCKGCGLCIEKCPKKCLFFSKESVGFLGTPSVEIEIKECIGCKVCEVYCPDCAISVEKEK